MDTIRILITGVGGQGTLLASRVLGGLAGELGCAAAADNNSAAAEAHYIFLCVKPQVLPQVAAALADWLRPAE